MEIKISEFLETKTVKSKMNDILPKETFLKYEKLKKEAILLLKNNLNNGGYNG